MNDRASALESDVAAPDVTPDFVPGDDERLESLATTGRGPLRIAAAAVLAADSRKAARLAKKATREAPARAAVDAKAEKAPARAARTASAPPAAAPSAGPPQARDLTQARIQRARSNHQGRLLNGPVDPVQKVGDDRAWERWESVQPTQDEPNGLERLDEPRRRSGLGRWRKGPETTEPVAPRTPGSAPAARRPAAPPAARPAPAATPARRTTRQPAAQAPAARPAQTSAARPAQTSAAWPAQPAARPTRPTRPTRLTRPVRPSRQPAPAPAHTSRKATAPAADGAAKPSWRQRASAALDRLAEQEVARGARLEQRVIPQLGRTNRR